MLENIFHLDLYTLIETVGYVGLFVIVFLESSFFPLLPGDSLLFAAGILAGSGVLNILPLMLIVSTAGFLGYLGGYWFGQKLGPMVFKKEDSILFNKKHLVETEHFFNRYGAWTIVFGRFIPFVRTLAPILAGAGKMDYRLFLICALAGSIIWGAGISFAGYSLGIAFPVIGENLELITILILIVSMIPVTYSLYTSRKAARDTKKSADS